jgi:sulfatase modifying factor 1
MRLFVVGVALAMIAVPVAASAPSPIDQTEVSIGQFAEFAEETGLITEAEKSGGNVFEAGWVQKPGWNWRTPYGVAASADEPAVHITFDEAQSYCVWRGKRLPTRDEWIRYAYTELRDDPPEPFKTGTTYRYPTGAAPFGANCLDDCGGAKGNPPSKTDQSHRLMRGYGHAEVGTTIAGVNGLYDMGANVWEWAVIGDGPQQATMGGSWWYGKTQMTADYGATKPRHMAAIYIGFRCIGFQP